MIRKVTVATGIITTVAGNGTAGYSGDSGLAVSASLNMPDGVTVDGAGNLYISDNGNNVIRKVMASTGIITTIVGNGTAGYSGDGGPATSAKLNDPSLGVALDAAGNIYISDDGNNVIRKVTVSTGKISTIAGTGTAGYSGDGGPATAAKLNGPESVTIDHDGNIYIADGSSVIRKITESGSVPATPIAILGTTSICRGSSDILSVAPVSRATSYTWTLPNGWSGTGTTDTIIAIADTSGTVSVTANNAFGPSLPQTIYVTVNRVNTSVTQAGTTLTANATGASYTWINCNGNIPVSGATHQSFTASNPGSYAVIITQNGCSDTSSCFLISVTSVPATPAAILGSTSICRGNSDILSVAPVSGAMSYTWTLPNGWSGTSTTDTIIAIADTSGTISVTANNAFGPSLPQSIHVTVNRVNTTVTQTGTTLSANASGASYIWLSCNGNIPVSGATHQSFTASNPGSYAVIITQNGCSDTSVCFLTDTTCNILITGTDMPYSGLSVLLAEDTITNISLGNPGGSQTWDYSMLIDNYNKFAVYNSTASSPYASVYTASNIYTYGSGDMFGILYGGAPVGPSNNGYIFWKSDSSGLWETGFRPDGGHQAGTNVQDDPHELLLGAPASYGSIFYNSARWVLPLNPNTSGLDTFFVRNISKVITADACGSLTTPHGIYPNVLREHEHLIQVDSVYLKMGSTNITSVEYKRDTLNNYSYISHGIGYPACIVHADKNNIILRVEYYSGIFTGINDHQPTEWQVQFYPNPVENSIHIIGSNLLNPARLEFRDDIGRLLFEKAMNTGPIIENLNISNYSAGVYMIVIRDEGGILATRKVIKN